MKVPISKSEEKHHQLSSGKVAQKKKLGSPMFQLADNHPKAVAQKKAIALVANSSKVSQLKKIQSIANNNAKDGPALQLKRNLNIGTRQIVQRVPYGTGAGTDNDRTRITTRPLAPGDQVDATGDGLNRAIINNMLVNGVNQVGKRLKHYMVVKSGFHFLFPIKHVLQPAAGANGRFHTNVGNNNGPRAGAAEGFGGNQDLATGVNRIGNLTGSRDNTLGHEYEEENHRHFLAPLNSVHRSVKFASPNIPATARAPMKPGMAGTLSIVNTNAPLHPGFKKNFRGPFVHRGEGEMAGTVVVNCADLINTPMNKDALEAAIGQRVEQQRIAMFQRYHDLRGHRAVQSSVAHEGGIFAHLVGLVADDLLAERARRNAARIAAAAAKARRDRKIAIVVVLILALGLYAFFKSNNFLSLIGGGKSSGPGSGHGEL